MSKYLDELNEYLKTQPYPFTRITEIHNGVSETLELSKQNPCQNCYSVAKSFTMTAIGLLFDKGLISLDDKVCDILSDMLPETGMDDRWHTVTVRMALTHRIGVPRGFLDIDCCNPLDFTEDYLTYMFTYPLEYTPDTDSKYSDAAFYLLSVIVEKITGIKTDDFLWKEILYKMKFRELAWSHCPKGHVMGATGLYIHSSDMAKLGQLYLDGGVYDGQRLLSEKWIKAVLDESFAFDWNDAHTSYHKGGMCGQKLFVFPLQNRVVAVQSFGGNTDVVEEFTEKQNCYS